ncbi:hypothetical protein [Rhodococcus sp. X156]|uniref:hypothetical protein n=1 Tax=Rhodococcus sp. X156 TaxID=2499145 RepID=UPI000FD85402|nr:hypothetical protein [Rhodococcus sp. X156]
MALHDELSRLDSEVAAGRISTEQFRQQRDLLLAAAGSGPASGGPFPPPFQWPDGAGAPAAGGVGAGATAEDRTQVVRRPAPAASTPAETDTSDRTQVVPRRGPTASSTPAEDRTQVVRRPAGATAPTARAAAGPAARPGSAAPTGDADRTQMVRSAPSGYSTVGAPPWARGGVGPQRGPSGSSPAGAEGNLPPWTLGQQPQAAPQRVGAHSDAAPFAGPASPSRRWLVPVAVLVVLAIVLALCLVLFL